MHVPSTTTTRPRRVYTSDAQEITARRSVLESADSSSSSSGGSQQKRQLGASYKPLACTSDDSKEHRIVYESDEDVHGASITVNGKKNRSNKSPGSSDKITKDGAKVELMRETAIDKAKAQEHKLQHDTLSNKAILYVHGLLFPPLLLLLLLLLLTHNLQDHAQCHVLYL